jgi:protein TonB
MRRERTNFAPALLAAIGLHLAVLVGGAIAWPWLGKPMTAASVTAVTLVAAPPAPLRPALEAPQAAPATAPEPTPEPPVPPPPAPAPKPPPQPAPKPTPKPAPAPEPKPTPTPTPTPTPKTPPAKPMEKPGLDLAALTSSLDKAAKTNAKPAAAKGAPSPETALSARDTPGEAEAATADAASAVGARLNRIWNKSCGVEGFRDIVVRVRFNLFQDGSLDTNSVSILNRPASASPVWDAASARAVIAIGQAAPFKELPRQTYAQWRTFTAVFDGKEACKNP